MDLGITMSIFKEKLLNFSRYIGITAIFSTLILTVPVLPACLATAMLWIPIFGYYPVVLEKVMNASTVMYLVFLYTFRYEKYQKYIIDNFKSIPANFSWYCVWNVFVKIAGISAILGLVYYGIAKGISLAQRTFEFNYRYPRNQEARKMSGDGVYFVIMTYTITLMGAGGCVLAMLNRFSDFEQTAKDIRNISLIGNTFKDAFKMIRNLFKKEKRYNGFSDEVKVLMRTYFRMRDRIVYSPSYLATDLLLEHNVITKEQLELIRVTKQRIYNVHPNIGEWTYGVHDVEHGEYKIVHQAPLGQIPPCKLIRVGGQLFDLTDNYLVTGISPAAEEDDEIDKNFTFFTTIEEKISGAYEYLKTNMTNMRLMLSSIVFLILMFSVAFGFYRMKRKLRAKREKEVVSFDDAPLDNIIIIYDFVCLYAHSDNDWFKSYFNHKYQLHRKFIMNEFPEFYDFLMEFKPEEIRKQHRIFYSFSSIVCLPLKASFRVFDSLENRDKAFRTLLYIFHSEDVDRIEMDDIRLEKLMSGYDVPKLKRGRVITQNKAVVHDIVTTDDKPEASLLKAEARKRGKNKKISTRSGSGEYVENDKQTIGALDKVLDDANFFKTHDLQGMPEEECQSLDNPTSDDLFELTRDVDGFPIIIPSKLEAANPNNPSFDTKNWKAMFPIYIIEDGEKKHWGTGFRAGQFLFTAHHVITNTSARKVYFYKGVCYDVLPIIGKCEDLCAWNIPKDCLDMPSFNIASPQTSISAMILGYKASTGQRLVSRILFKKSQRMAHYGDHDGDTFVGMSGSPIVSTSCRVIGIHCGNRYGLMIDSHLLEFMRNPKNNSTDAVEIIEGGQETIPIDKSQRNRENRLKRKALKAAKAQEAAQEVASKTIGKHKRQILENPQKDSKKKQDPKLVREKVFTQSQYAKNFVPLLRKEKERLKLQNLPSDVYKKLIEQVKREIQSSVLPSQENAVGAQLMSTVTAKH